MMRYPLGLLVLLGTIQIALAQPPTSTDPRLVIELVAEQPDIKTPTGIAVDERGRIWVIENNTHFRPPGYDGHPSDRILIFEDFDEKGKARKRSTFADGFKDSMGITLHQGSVFLATRSELFVLKDTKGDGKADEKKRLVHLETKGNYPHNGLSGFAFDPLGNMYFALGENLGVPYKIVGSDGTTLEGGGEGGNIYRCKPDGSKLTRVATGFWNTFHLCFDAFGRLFAVDNDPDSRPPCRLLHIVQGGDYGYRFRNGRKGLHPFTAWNGELPGTLPMVAGTAEAPSGIVAYESTGLPEEYRGKLLVTSWGDHVVQCFTLQEKGASFTATAKPLIQGGDQFRPVGIAVGPDGALYLSDWVDRSYPVHGKGRIWRIRMKEPPADDGIRASQMPKLEVEKLRELLAHRKIEIRQAAADALVERARGNPKMADQILETVRDAVRQRRDLRGRLHALWAGVQIDPNLARQCVAELFRDTPVELRSELSRFFASLRMDKKEYKALLDLIVESKQPASVRLQVIQQLRGEMVADAVPYLIDTDPFLASAAIEIISTAGVTPGLERLARDDNPRYRLAALLALRRIDDPAARKLVKRFLDDADPAVRRAAIQWVAEDRLKEFADQLKSAATKPPYSRDLFEAYVAALELLDNKGKPEEPFRQDSLAAIVEDKSLPVPMRTWAVRMLRPDHPAMTLARITSMLESKEESERREGLRILAARSDAGSQELVRTWAGSDGPTALRAEAVAGLARSAETPASQAILLKLLDDKAPELQREAIRSLRSVAGKPEVAQAMQAWSKKTFASSPAESKELAEQVLLAFRGQKEQPEWLKPLAALVGPRPKTEADWQALLASQGDAAAGERAFFHPQGAGCFNCHRVHGRGATIGPDLTRIGASQDRHKLIESILTPSKEVAPQFATWVFTTRDGKIITGIITNEDTSGFSLADAQGKPVRVLRKDIEELRAAPNSIMPDNLHEQLTIAELRDVIAFLISLK